MNQLQRFLHDVEHINHRCDTAGPQYSDEKWTQRRIFDYIIESFIPLKFADFKKDFHEVKSEMERIKPLSQWDL